MRLLFPERMQIWATQDDLKEGWFGLFGLLGFVRLRGWLVWFGLFGLACLRGWLVWFGLLGFCLFAWLVGLVWLVWFGLFAWLVGLVWFAWFHLFAWLVCLVWFACVVGRLVDLVVSLGVRLDSGRSRVRIPPVTGFFRGRVIPVTQKLALHWLPCQAPGVIGSALGLVGAVSVYCDWVRQKVGSATFCLSVAARKIV